MKLPVARLHELLTYDPVSGALRWKLRDENEEPRDLVRARFNALFALKPAGSNLRDKGYRRVMIKIDGSNYPASHVAWAMGTGAWPTALLDHVDGDATKNSLVNLREADTTCNNRNASRRKDNSSGATGVDFHKASSSWRFRVGSGDNRIEKTGFSSKEEADTQARQARMQQNYAERHGTERATL